MEAARLSLEDRMESICGACLDAIVPGVLFPIDCNGQEHAYVQRCDECAIFEDDVVAAAILAIVLAMTPRVCPSGLTFIEGITFTQALALKAHKYKVPRRKKAQGTETKNG